MEKEKDVAYALVAGDDHDRTTDVSAEAKDKMP